MSNDARLGMAVGVGLVIAVAVFFHRKDAPRPARPAQAASTLSRARASRPLPPPAPADPAFTVSSEKKPAAAQEP